jgi:hypothetical protein
MLLSLMLLSHFVFFFFFFSNFGDRDERKYQMWAPEAFACQVSRIPDNADFFHLFVYLII